MSREPVPQMEMVYTRGCTNYQPWSRSLKKVEISLTDKFEHALEDNNSGCYGNVPNVRHDI